MEQNIQESTSETRNHHPTPPLPFLLHHPDFPQMSIPCTKKEVGARERYLRFHSSSPKRVRNKTGGGRSRVSGGKKRKRRRRKEKRWEPRYFILLLIERAQSRERGREGSPDESTVGFLSFYAFAFWTTATKGAQSGGISEPCCYLARLFAARPTRVAPSSYPREQLFFLRHTPVSEHRLFDLRPPPLHPPSSFRSLSNTIPSSSSSPFYRSALNDRDLACSREKGRGTAFAKNRDDYYWSMLGRVEAE